MNFTTQELQDAAKRPGFANGEVYTGQDDRTIDFGQGSSFADERTGEITITIDGSAAAADKTIALHPGMLATAAQIKDENGTAVDAILVDGVVIVGAISASATPKSIASVQGYTHSNPTRIVGIKVSVDDIEQLDSAIYYREESPFRNVGDDRRIPSSYKSENQQNEKIATIKDLGSSNWIMGANSVLIYKVLAGRKVTLTFYMGASASAFNHLKRASNDGRANLAQLALMSQGK